MFYNASGDFHDYCLAYKSRHSPLKVAHFWDKASKWLVYYNFKIYQHFNVQRQNYMALKNDVPLPKTFQAFYKAVTKKLTIFNTVMEEEEHVRE